MNPWIKSALIFTAGLLSGCAATGLAIHYSFNHFRSHPPNPERIAGRLASKLGLNDDQRRKTAALLKDDFSKADSLRRNTEDQLEAMRNSFPERLKTILDPDQQKKLAELSKKWGHHDFGGRHFMPYGPLPPQACPSATVVK
jgi:hypothetical protein